MLRNVSEITGFSIAARDGDMGVVETLYFDDREWIIRYLVVDCGNWFPGRQVLIPPGQFDGPPDWDAKTFPVGLTMDAIKQGPAPAAHEPVARRKIREWMEYYDNWPVSWQNRSARPPARGLPIPENGSPDTRLRDAHEILHYRVLARDGRLGDIEDTVFDDVTWAVRFLVIQTDLGDPYTDVLVAPEWIERIEWEEQAVHVDLDKESVAASPPYDAFSRIEEDYAGRLYQHYGRKR